MNKTVLEFESITKAYNAGQPNAVQVLNGAGGRIEQGEVIALSAPSGAGKSTLLHILGLLDQADSGKLLLNGADVGGADDKTRSLLRRQSIGFVYQFHHLLPEFSALENIILPQLALGRSRAQAHEKAMHLLDSVALAGRASHRPAALSGGEQQRVAICRALANDPQILLADEPTGNLDPETSDQVFSILMDMARATGLSALIATHNLDLANRMDKKWNLAQCQIQTV